MNMSRPLSLSLAMAAFLSWRAAEARQDGPMPRVVITCPGPRTPVRLQAPRANGAGKRRDAEAGSAAREALRKAAAEREAELERQERAVVLGRIREHMDGTPALAPEEDMFRRFKEGNPAPRGRDEFARWREDRPGKPDGARPKTPTAEEQSSALSGVLGRALDGSRGAGMQDHRVRERRPEGQDEDEEE